MHPADLHADLAYLEHLHTMQARAWAAEAADQVRRALDDGDWDELARLHGADVRLSDVDAARLDSAREAGPGVGACLSSNNARQRQRTHERGDVGRLIERASTAKRRAERLARLRMAVGMAARAHQALPKHGFRADLAKFVTLTYRPGVAWEAGHIRQALNRLRDWCAELGIPCRYVWVAELQRRGVIHYHVVCWVPHGTYLPQFDTAGWWPHGSTQVETARNAVSYLMKYLSKGSGALSLPKGARAHGSGGLSDQARAMRRWLHYPEFIKARTDVQETVTRSRWRRRRGGGWLSPDGECVPSEYRRVRLDGGLWECVRVCDHGRPFSADGPFSWVR